MLTRTTVFALIAAVSLVTASVQAIGSDEIAPESSVVGLGQSLAGSAAATAAPRSVGARSAAQR